MTPLRRLLVVVTAIAALSGIAGPVHATPSCDNLPDLSQYGWKWPC